MGKFAGLDFGQRVNLYKTVTGSVLLALKEPISRIIGAFIKAIVSERKTPGNVTLYEHFNILDDEIDRRGGILCHSVVSVCLSLQKCHTTGSGCQCGAFVTAEQIQEMRIS